MKECYEVLLFVENQYNMLKIGWEMASWGYGIPIKSQKTGFGLKLGKDNSHTLINYIYIYIYIYINTIKSSCTECNKNNIDIQKKHYRLNVSTEVFISNTLQIKWS